MMSRTSGGSVKNVGFWSSWSVVVASSGVVMMKLDVASARFSEVCELDSVTVGGGFAFGIGEGAV